MPTYLSIQYRIHDIYSITMASTLKGLVNSIFGHLKLSFSNKGILSTHSWRIYKDASCTVDSMYDLHSTPNPNPIYSLPKIGIFKHCTKLIQTSQFWSSSNSKILDYSQDFCVCVWFVFVMPIFCDHGRN